jgi:hypothetical protein
MNITITDNADIADIADFVPLDGSYDINITPDQIEKAIADELSAKHGFAFNVEIFRANGNAISSETPTAGVFLAVRK